MFAGMKNEPLLFAALSVHVSIEWPEALILQTPSASVTLLLLLWFLSKQGGDHDALQRLLRPERLER